MRSLQGNQGEKLKSVEDPFPW